MVKREDKTSRKSTRKIDTSMTPRSDSLGIVISEDSSGSVSHRISCDPSCGFMVQSSDEDEARFVIREHARKAHNLKISDSDIRQSADAVPAGVG